MLYAGFLSLVVYREMNWKGLVEALSDTGYADANVYGECVDCGEDIPLERLEALPFALRCAMDAARHEEERMGGPVVSSTL